MYNSENLQEKWQPVLQHPDLPEIKDSYKKAVTSIILENQEKAMKEDAAFLSEAAPTNNTGGTINNYDPILISLVRRAMPNLIAYDVCSVQPMTGPTGLIFAMKSNYDDQNTGFTANHEAFYNEAESAFSGSGENGNIPGSAGTSSNGETNPAVLNDGTPGAYTADGGMTTGTAEALGDGSGAGFAQMAFSIEKASVEAKSRALKAEYTMELAQDLKAIHGLDAETELANILSTEILAEINREVIRTINSQAKDGAQQANVTVNGVFNMSSDADGRWSAEKFKGLGVQIDRECNQIAKDSRRGKGNILICSSDVATALAAAGTLDYSPGISNNLNVDDTGNTFAGLLNGRIKVYIDPYANTDYCTVGYKGTNPYDAGVFYCPYVPLQMVKAVGEDTFQPRIGFKTRYGMASNPFVGSTPANGLASVKTNFYYRIFKVTNILT